MEAMLHSPGGSTILGAGIISIGATPDNQLVLSDAGVGTHHAEIRPEGQGHSIIDLGSGTSTLVNGQRLYPQVPQILQNGDTITIGSAQLTYETRSSSGVPPTIYASPGNSGVPPTVMASGSPGGISPTVYGSSAAGSNSAYSLPSSTTPPPPVASTPAAPPPPTSGYSIDPYGSSVPKKKSRRGLWIALSVVGGLLVIIIVFVAVAGKGPSSTPTQTFQAYCAALKAKDANTAYGFYSSGTKSQTSVDTMKALGNSISDCAVSSVDDTAGTGVITYTLTSGLKLLEDDKVVQDNNSWKINYQKVRSTPSYTLYQYCSALKQGDFQAAYNQFSSSYQSQQSEAKFAASFPDGKPDGCTFSNVDDAAGKGMVTMAFKGPQTSYDETLANENGTWKINTEQEHK
ncbi:hypothetical protein KSF_000500 [Reticulibacter mediterranei]|uniref:FHA domain-containing protein n=1 Tax=Reticulibacter mediterranei TaxID=2778369 RepID=A0A8J3N095_9CHLR|nr:FHA domain-containing protein [Reticulibacter mediterranei]GHO90002.1 hypothetical protein KSF_000500 [Reticulibacter mediterranei]